MKRTVNQSRTKVAPKVHAWDAFWPKAVRVLESWAAIETNAMLLYYFSTMDKKLWLTLVGYKNYPLVT